MLTSISGKNAPDSAGVYIFSHNGIPIYIGKAANLKKRLASYWRNNASEKVRLMTQEATKLEWIETESEIEALLKEAELIKKYRPKYNILMRDDKNYFYVGFTKEKFPRIFITHQLTNLQPTTHNSQPKYVGPFTSGAALHSTLRLLRRIFSYCTCSKPHKRPCLNAEIGRCPGYCCYMKHESGIRNQKEYAKNIKNIIAVLKGRRMRIISKFKQEMKISAQRQEFEKATKLRDQILGLENIFSHRRLLEARPPAGGRASPKWRDIARFIRDLLNMKKSPFRVEGYDISNISGRDATGSMVVFINGLPAKSEYRKFKIKTVEDANDVAMHREVIRRRTAHNEWQYPDLMIIDGGKPQLNAATAVLKFKVKILKLKVPFITALAKREEELYTENRSEPIPLKTLPQDVMHFFQRVRDESHRFAKKYHHKLREISYREK